LKKKLRQPLLAMNTNLLVDVQEI